VAQVRTLIINLSLTYALPYNSTPITTSRLATSQRIKLTIILFSRWATPYRIHGKVTIKISAQVISETPVALCVENMPHIWGKTVNGPTTPAIKVILSSRTKYGVFATV